MKFSQTPLYIYRYCVIKLFEGTDDITITLQFNSFAPSSSGLLGGAPLTISGEGKIKNKDSL